MFSHATHDNIIHYIFIYIYIYVCDHKTVVRCVCSTNIRRDSWLTNIGGTRRRGDTVTCALNPLSTPSRFPQNSIKVHPPKGRMDNATSTSEYEILQKHLLNRQYTFNSFGCDCIFSSCQRKTNEAVMACKWNAL